MTNLTSVFLVEDDEDDQFFFINALNSLRDITLLDTARNGREALDKLKRVSLLPQLIFVDYNMPVMNGLDFLFEKSKDPSIKHIPVVMLSASMNIREEAISLGAKAFIQKQSDENALSSAVELVLDSLAIRREVQY